jgi:hypothetical protein
LLSKITSVTAGFSKNYKYSLGENLRVEAVELVVCIYKANSTRGADRVEHISAFLERLQVVELILRLSKDLRLIDVKQFAEIVTMTDSLGRQATGWIKSSPLLAESK